MIDVRVHGANELARVAKQLKDAGDKDLSKELRKAIRTGAKPAVTATQAAVRNIPVTGSRGGGRAQRETFHAERSKAKDEAKRRAKAQRKSGLRATIADAVVLKVKTGSKSASVRIEVDEKRIPPDQRTLPRHLDSKKGWRHPVFGNRDVWASQKGRPWFETTIRRHLPAIRRDVFRALERVAKQIN